MSEEIYSAKSWALICCALSVATMRVRGLSLKAFSAESRATFWGRGITSYDASMADRSLQDDNAMAAKHNNGEGIFVIMINWLIYGVDNS